MSIGTIILIILIIALLGGFSGIGGGPFYGTGYYGGGGLGLVIVILLILLLLGKLWATHTLIFVMAGLVPAIYVLFAAMLPPYTPSRYHPPCAQLRTGAGDPVFQSHS